MKLYLLFACVLLSIPNAVDAKPAPKAAPQLDMKKTVEEIRAYCGITSGQFTYSDKSIHVNYDGMIEAQKLECASQRAILLGIYFDSYDSTAPYSGPSRFLIKGPPQRLDAAAKDAVSVGWKVTHRADAGDGMAFLEVEAGSNLSRRVVQEFIDKFSRGDFHDIAIGLAPQTMYGHDQPATEAVFRSAARSMYGALANKSCNPAPGFNRDAEIEVKRLAVGALEDELAKSAVASSHLAIAKQDAAYIKPSGLTAECDDPGSEPIAKLSTETLAAAKVRLAALKKLLVSTTPQ